MNTPRRNIHRGELLASIVATSRSTISEIAKRAGYSRSSYYNHIKNRNLAFEILQQYGKALHYDFTEEFPKMPKYLVDDASENRPQPATFAEAISDRDYWKEKYYSLLERHTLWLEQKLDKAL